ncbi:phosphotransferase [uncultured Amaricoccus sp.]|uniref:aminoglycoside phosphotransferase family protein n=1 Tax=uncultured Amaricoccus sp. TaxID=339341 RepID=UPI00260861D3|nr:phosphotransferase [uncultured Amaricoccus sp.]
MSRSARIDDFLAAAGWAGARRAPLAGDASARRYERIGRGDRRAMLMDAPPETGLDLAPFIAVTGWLRGHGLAAPEILATDPADGLLLLEDLGDDLFATLCAADSSRAPELYGAAIDLLVHFQSLPPPGGDWTPPPYDMAVLMREARLATEWYLPAATGAPAGTPPPPDLAAEFDALAEAAFAPLLPASTVPIYRDYHAENLLWLPKRAGHARIGLLDYQDMLIGHPAYDLVSLLEDARRDVDPALRTAMIARYRDRAGTDAEALDQAAHVLSAQRNLKILGLFTRLARRDGKPRYLGYLPRVWTYLKADLAHPALAPLAAWVEARLPPPGGAA